MHVFLQGSVFGMYFQDDNQQIRTSNIFIPEGVKIDLEEPRTNEDETEDVPTISLNTSRLDNLLAGYTKLGGK